MARLILLSGDGPVDPGEQIVVGYLQKTLPDSYLLYPNIEIMEPGRPAFEYDVIVVAPHAVYVVEIKRWLGSITGGDQQWILEGGAVRSNPLQSTNLKAKVLASRLVRTDDTLRVARVVGCVAIADEHTVLHITGGAAERTFLYPDLPAFLEDPLQVPKTGRPLEGNAIAHLRSQIRDAIEQEARQRTSAPLRFGHYEVIETLARTELTDEYLARHIHLAGSTPVRLRVFADPPYVPVTQRAAHRQRIERDAKTVRSLSPHPNLVAIHDLFPDSAGHWIEVTEWSETGTLRDALTKGLSLSDEQRLDVFMGVARGLAAAHGKGIIHRAVRPDNILLGADLTPRLMNFDLARLDAPAAGTVWQLPEGDADRRYLAPELDRLNPTATPASDLYALGALTYELYAGQVPYASPAELERAGGVPVRLTDLQPDVSPDIADLATALYQMDPTRRPQTAQEVIERLERLKAPPAAPSGPNDAALPPLAYRTGELIAYDYKVMAVLGGGAFARVYRVYHRLTHTEYALKVIDGHYNLDRLQEEYDILRTLSHANIAKVMWAGAISPDQFYLVVELIDGYPLSEFIDTGHLLPVPEVMGLFKQLLSALDYIHQPKREREMELSRRQAEGDELTQEEFEELMEAKRRYLHRDIKPHNLMLAKSGQLKVIDFNIAAIMDAQLRYTRIGTQSYLAPDIQLLGWDESVDLFAAGVTLYQLITGHHPYPDDDPASLAGPEPPQTYRPDLSDEFAYFLYQAVQPNRADRFSSAAQMHTALLNLDEQWLKQGVPATPAGQETDGFRPRGEEDLQPGWPFKLDDEEVGKANYNPYVTRLLTLYSQARRSNAGTRGLDEIARATYIHTWLDDRLRPDILAGKHRLVIITGNAGDGKTAFIQQLETEAERLGGEVQALRHATGRVNGSCFHLAGIEFETNYDGSQDEGDRSNDEVLSEFLGPFRGENPFETAGALGRIIAINEGRLRDFLHVHRREFPYLARTVTAFFDEEGHLPDGMLVVNLNWRAVVAGGAQSIFTRQLKQLVAPQFWMACHDCAFKEQCFIKANADRLADPTSGDEIIERLRVLFETVYLRRRLHITMRDLRSALSYLLLRDQNCEDIARTLESHVLDTADVDAKLDYLAGFYYNAFAAPDEPSVTLNAQGRIVNHPEPPDRLVRLLAQLDPALVANPTDDRVLHFTDHQSLSSLLLLGFTDAGYDHLLLADVKQLVNSVNGNVAMYADRAALARRLRLHAMLRRKSLFERRDSDWRRMLPYQHAAQFLALAQQSDPMDSVEEVTSNIAFAISTAEGMRHPSYAQRFVSLRAGSNPKASIKSFRLFPAHDFRLRTPHLGALSAYIEYLPDRIFLEHALEGQARLTISLDLFELLMRVGQGTVPSPADLQGYFLNLTIFKNALAHLPYREVLLTDNDQQFYRIWADEHNVVHMQATTPEA